MNRSLVVGAMGMLLIVALAGCATPEVPSNGEAPMAGDDGASDGGEATGESGGPTWGAYAFSEPVQAGGSSLGTLEGYSFTSVTEERGERTELSVDVTYNGMETRDIRTVERSFDQQSGEQSEETVSTPVEVYPLVHEVEVVEDQAGAAEAGDRVTVSTYLPAGELESFGQTFWFFVKMDVETDGGTSLFEYYLTDGMQEQMQSGSTFYTPYTEGEDVLAWWGFSEFAVMYGLQFFQPFVDGSAELEEGSWGYGGFSYSVQEVSFDLSGHTFDGYEITWKAEGEGSQEGGEMTLTVSPDLPVPYHYRMFTGDGGDGNDDSLQEFQLTAIQVGS